MKKTIIYLIAIFFLIGFVGVVQANASLNEKGQENLNTINSVQKTSISGNEVKMMYGNENKVALNQGEFQMQNGKTLFVTNEGERMKLRIGNYSVNCSSDCNLSQIREENKIQLHATLSNGRNAEIKIMPETASQTAIDRLRLKSCGEENCTIELKEVGKGNETKMAYEFKTKKEAKFLGLFKSQVNVETQIDAETGEVISTKKPWWVSLKEE